MKHILKIFIILLIPTIAFSSSQSKMKDLMPVYRFYKDKKKLPTKIYSEIKKELKKIELKTKKKIW